MFRHEIMCRHTLQERPDLINSYLFAVAASLWKIRESGELCLFVFCGHTFTCHGHLLSTQLQIPYKGDGVDQWSDHTL